MNHLTALPQSQAPGPTVVDDALLQRVLRPYRAKNCTYLKAMSLDTAGDVVRGLGELEIPESCYIDDTGHLNAAEVVICFNQMLYTLLAVVVRDRLLPVFGSWSEDDYWRCQLDGVLITRFASTFVRPISPRRFRGEIGVGRTLSGGGKVCLQFTFRFSDDEGGRCDGDVRVAVVAP